MKFSAWVFRWKEIREDLPGGELLLPILMAGRPNPNLDKLTRLLVERQLFDPWLVEADSVEDVYRILNIEHPKGYELRSLSVGDIVVQLSPREYWQVAPVGFRRIFEEAGV